jgi:hypothetical protein
LKQLKNVPTTPSVTREVSARIDLLQAAQFIDYGWRGVKTKTIQNCHFSP